MDKDEIYHKIIKKIYGRKKYRDVANGLHGAIKQRHLTAAAIVDFVIFCADRMEAKTRGDAYDPEASPSAHAARIALDIMIVNKKFSRESWQSCLTEMIKIYFAIIWDLPDGAEQGIYLPPMEDAGYDGMPRIREYVMRSMVDGNELTPNEIIFEDFCAARFDEKAWCEKWRIKYDSELARVLEEKYRRIGWTTDHTKLLPLPRR